jgi:membrane-bound ClpP family serine protease
MEGNMGLLTGLNSAEKIRALEEEKNNYLILVKTLREVNEFGNLEQLSIVSAKIKEYEEKAAKADHAISELKKFDESIHTRYRILYTLLMALSLLTILFFIFDVSSGDAAIITGIFLFVQYMALLFLNANAKKKIVYIAGLALFFVPLLILVLRPYVPLFQKSDSIYIYIAPVIAVYNFITSLYNNLSKKYG